jgi:hypothetical protein
MKASTTTEKTIASSTLIVPRPRSEMFGVTRRIIQFLLAPMTLRTLLLVPLGFVLYKIAVHFDLPLKGLLLNYLPLLLVSFVAAIGLRFGAQLRAGADQIFFSETHHQEQLIASLVEQLTNFPDLSEVIYHTCRTLNEAYQSTPIHFFFRATRELKLVYSYGGASDFKLIPEESRLRSLLKREGQAFEYLPDAKLSLPPQEQAWLTELQARMLVPLTGKDRRVLGLITLGEKRVSHPYSANDYALLDAIGEHLARRIEREEIRNQVNQQSNAPLATLARLEAEIKQQPPLKMTSSATTPRYAPDDPQTTNTPPIEEEKPSWI